MAIKKKTGLGRGLGALIPSRISVAITDDKKIDSDSLSASNLSERTVVGSGVQEISLSQIEANPDQPRTSFSHQSMEELTESVRQHGILQPLALTPKANGGYEVIAGERRLRAARLAGLKTVPAVIRQTGGVDKLVLALIENIQREDLNPIEEARAYKRLSNEFGLAQEEIAKQVGKARSTVANTIRLLELPEEILDTVVAGKVSAGNARALLAISDNAARLRMFHRMISEGMTVREAEADIQKVSTRVRKDSELLAAEDELRRHYGTKVLVTSRNGQGKVELKFFSNEEFEVLLKKLLD